MPTFWVKRRISGLLVQKKDNASSTSLELSAGPNTSSTSSLPDIETMLHALQEEEEQLEAAMALSRMQMHLDQKQAELDQIRSQLLRLQQDHDQVVRESRANEADANSWRRYHAQLDPSNQVLQPVTAKLTKERDQALAENAELRSELQKFQAWATQMGEVETRAREMEGRMEQMKQQNQIPMQGSNADVRECFQERLKSQERQQELQRRVKGFDEALAKKTAECRAQFEIISRREEAIEGLNRLLQEERGVKTALQLELAEAKEQLARLMQAREDPATIASEVTPRAILAVKLMRPIQSLDACSNLPGAQGFLDNCDLGHITRAVIDLPLASDQASKLAADIDRNPGWKDGLILHTCAVCNMPKFSTMKQDGWGWMEHIDEFPSRRKRTPCCKKPVCSPCLLKGLTQAPQADWYGDMGQRRFIRCPVSTCKKDTNIRNCNEYRRQLESLGDATKDYHVSLYRRAEAIRSAFYRATRDRGRIDDAARIMKAMHEHLQANGLMRPLFDLSVPDTALRSCRLVEITPPGIDYSISVPLFPGFFKMRQEDCIVCSETHTTVDYGNSVQGWVDAIGIYGGDWIWKVSKFPLKLVQLCGESHNADVCVDCVARHLQVQLEEFGRDGCDKLCCPSYHCNRRLTYEEVRMYAENEVFVKYDRFHLLNELNSKENFRWCLGPNCESGQLYVFDEDDDQNVPINCEECGFSMCFRHQIAWHDGMTCQQYDSQQAIEFLDSVDWIAQNSKKCPGCDVSIIKGEACFHMTCSRCQFEFCWVCLADWKKIHPGGRRYDRNAHNDGCWFKGRDVMPTQLLGNNVEQAAREQNFE